MCLLMGIHLRFAAPFGPCGEWFKWLRLYFSLYNLHCSLYNKPPINTVYGVFKPPNYIFVCVSMWQAPKVFKIQPKYNHTFMDKRGSYVSSYLRLWFRWVWYLRFLGAPDSLSFILPWSLALRMSCWPLDLCYIRFKLLTTIQLYINFFKSFKTVRKWKAGRVEKEREV